MKRPELAIALVLALNGAASAQDMSYGEAEFLSSCAACHGIEARGDGPMTEVLMQKPADLTILQQENGGLFPYNRVFSTIDGRFQVPSHGDREMPIWGRHFIEEDTKVFGPKAGEIVTEERVHELTNYIQSLQR